MAASFLLYYLSRPVSFLSDVEVRVIRGCWRPGWQHQCRRGTVVLSYWL